MAGSLGRRGRKTRPRRGRRPADDGDAGAERGRDERRFERKIPVDRDAADDDGVEDSSQCGEQQAARAAHGAAATAPTRSNRERDNRADNKERHVQIIRSTSGLTPIAGACTTDRAAGMAMNTGMMSKKSHGIAAAAGARTGAACRPSARRSAGGSSTASGCRPGFGPERKADQPAGRRRLWIEHARRRSAPAAQAAAARQQTPIACGMVAQAHCSLSLASGTWATVAWRDSCSARI